MRKLLLVLLAASVSYVNAQTSRNFVGDSLDTYINEALTGWNIPGIAVCIVKDGKPVWAKGYGVADIQNGAKVDANTLFMIGSNTKAFTGTALAMLHVSKKMSLNQPVVEQMPAFKLYDPWVTKEVTAVDLLAHRLGFETFQGDFMYFDSDLTAAQVREKFSKLKPMHSFRSRWGYCNAGYAVAGDLVAKVSGTSWARFLTDSIFKPLGMTRTIALGKDLAAANNKAAAHTVAYGELKKVAYGRIDNLAAAGSISSSANDMANWAIAIMDNGRLNGMQVIPQSAITLTQKPWSVLGDGGAIFNSGHFVMYGLGWLLQEYNGKKIVSHTGGINGFVTSLTLIPEDKVGIIVLTNTDSNNFYEALKLELMDAYLQLPYRNYSGLFLEEYNKETEDERKRHLEKIKLIAQKPKPSFPIKNILGSYTHEVYGKMTISEEKGKYLARFEHHKNRQAELNALGDTQFYAEFNESLFGRNDWNFTVENGVVRSVTVRVSGFIENTPYEFVKDNPGK